MINKFLVIEDKYDLFYEKINDFYFWHYIRFGVYREIERQLNYIDTILPISYKQKAGLMANKLITSSLGNYKNRRDVFITCKIDHKTSQGKYSNVYLEPILKSLKKTFVVFELRPTDFRKNDYEISNVYNGLELYVYSEIYKTVVKKPKVFDAFSKEFESAINEINEKYSCNITHNMISTLIYKCYIRRKFSEKYFKKVFETIKPKVILEICSYTLDNMIINEVAKELKIPTIELQHGIMGEGHIAYNFLKKQNLPALPDYIFTYSDFWNNTTKFPISDENVIATGFPHLEKLVKEGNGTKREKISIEHKVSILFISQWTIAKRLSEFAVDFYDYLIENYEGEFKITYKMHPGDNIENMQCFEKLSKYRDKIEIVSHSEKTLYDCFLEADVQIGAYSTGIYEGLAFGLKTYLVKVEGSERMQTLVDKGFAKYVEYPQDVNLNDNAASNSENGDFWKENALDNIIKNINAIMKEG